MKRPFVILCTGLLIGIIASISLNYVLPQSYLILFILLTGLALIFDEGLFKVLFLVTIIILGNFLYGQGIGGQRILENLDSSLRLRGRVLKGAGFKKGYSQYEIEIINILVGEDHRGVRINERAQVNIYGPLEDLYLEQFMVGDIIEIKNPNIKTLLKGYEKDNINSYELYLRARGLAYIINTNGRDIGQVNIGPKNINMGNASYKARLYVEEYLDTSLEFENSDILKSIIFGNEGYLSRDRLDLFSKTGTAHIMAVSGLHIGLIVLIVDRFLRLVRVSRNKRLILTTAVLVFYGFMVYYPLSIVRAGAMYLLYVGGYFLHRRYDSINALFLIAFALLVHNPLTIFSISFQLSFLATLSVLLLSPILNKKLGPVLGPLAPLLSVTLAAQLGTLPIMAYHFRQISLVSTISNILIVPLIGPMLAIAFTSIMVGSLSLRLGFLINKITDRILSYINWLTVKGATIPYGSIEVSEVKLTHLIIYYLILAILFYYMFKKNEKNSLNEERSVEACGL